MDRKGFSLIEIMIGLAISAIVMASTSYFLLGQQNSYQGQKGRLDQVGNARISMDFITRTLRGAVVSATSGIPTGAACSTSLTFLYIEDQGRETAATADTLTDSSKNWTVNQWTDYQIVITAGTGSGQTRMITANTATQVTAGSDWATTPDATSAYKIVSERQFYRTGTNVYYKNDSVNGGAAGILAENVTCFTIANDAAPPRGYDVTLTMTTPMALPDTGKTGATTLQASVAVRN